MINLGLERTARLLQHIARDYFHQPTFQPPWRVAHIAGTNGKGSVAAYLSSLLRLNGDSKADHLPLRVGRFTSPHFIDRWDCIQINDKPVTRNAFLSTEQRMKAIAKDVEDELRSEIRQSSNVSDQNARITEFELLTATAFTLFTQSDPRPCDIAVIECGLGGRLDATNVLPSSNIAVSIITRIGLDHLDILGGSLESIVKEKCGIFRPGVPVIVDADNSAEVLGVIQERYTMVNEHESESRVYSKRGSSDLPTMIDSPSVDVLMPHQQANLAVALQACSTLLSIDAHTISADLVSQAIMEAGKSYPARLQVFQPDWLQGNASNTLKHIDQVPVVLDGAHNPQSAAVLQQFVSQFLRSENRSQNQRLIIWIIALSSTKPPAEMISALFPADSSSFGTHHIIFTSFGPVDGMPWVQATSPTTLLQSTQEQGLNASVVCTSTIAEALEQADALLAERDLQAQQPIIVIAGSLYLASDFLRLIRTVDW